MAYTTTGGYGVAGAGTTPPIYPTGSITPTPAYAGTFIPILWSTKLIEKFYASTVLAAISNTDYEGEIKSKGDTVVIRTKPTITIRDYLADGLLTIDRPSSNIIELKIDKGKYFNLILDDVYEVQSDLNMMNMWSDDAAQQFKIVIDTRGPEGNPWSGRYQEQRVQRQVRFPVTSILVPPPRRFRSWRVILPVPQARLKSSICWSGSDRRLTSRISPKPDGGLCCRRGSGRRSRCQSCVTRR